MFVLPEWQILKRSGNKNTHELTFGVIKILQYQNDYLAEFTPSTNKSILEIRTTLILLNAD